MCPRTLLTGTMLAAAATAASAADPAPRTAYSNKQVINFPVRMSEQDRRAVRALKLYVKPPGGVWIPAETATPQTQKFTYQAAGEGEYCFSFATVDQSGRESPANPEQDNQRLTVILDVQPPTISAASFPVASGPTYIQCSMRDSHPDRASLRAECEAPDGSWVALAPLDPNTPGVFRAPEGGLPPRLRVTGRDLAGNTATQVIALAAMTIASAPTPVVSAPTPMPTQAEPRVSEKPPEVTTTRQLLGTRRCVLNYAIDGVSPTAVTRVEAYGTRDDGKSWQRLGDDADRQSPVELVLPDDGSWGVSIIVSTLSQPCVPPGPGETPDWWVEVDATPPEVKLESAVAGTGDDAGLLVLRWSVRDANLTPDSVEALWAQSPDGPWLSIAKGLRADGQYRWPVPREAGGRVHLKIEVPDRAGNVGRFVTAQPIALEFPRAKARVIGINPTAVRP